METSRNLEMKTMRRLAKYQAQKEAKQVMNIESHL